jgi:hypothetical protein
MCEFVSNSLGKVRVTDIGKLTIRQLTTLYNEMRRPTDAPVRKFESHGAAIKAVLAFFSPEKEGSHRLVITNGDLQADGRRTKRFNLPCRFKPRRMRSGSKRALIAELLSRPEGATFRECQAAGGWDYRQTYDNIRLLHVYCGFGLREDDAGNIFLIAEPERSKS